MKARMAYFILVVLCLQAACSSDPASTAAPPVERPAYALSPGDSVLICEGKTSYAYHLDYCQGLKQCRAEVKRVALTRAQAMKRKPCGYCFGNQPSPYSVSPSQTSESGQCTAITKKGRRCSRKARSNNRCWQHGG